jgi:hypothetical protein
MKCNLGSEVLLRVKTLGKYNFATTDGQGLCLVCQAITAYSSTSYPNVGITKDGQGCHHLLPTPKLWDMRQTKVMCRLDTMSTLTATTLALARNFRLY